MARMVASSSLKRLLAITTHWPTPLRPLCLGKSYRYDLRSTLGSWAKTKMARSFPGMDYKHWFVVMVAPQNTSKEELINYYVNTLTQVLGSEEIAKEKIYKVVLDPRYDLGFGCEVGWEIVEDLQDLPEVACVLAEAYVGDPENKDYMSVRFVKGKAVEREHEGESNA